MTDVVSQNGHDWWADHSDNGQTWWAGGVSASDTVPPPPPPPPPPAPAPAPAAARGAVVPPVSPAPPAHPTPPTPIAVPAAADPDGDGWTAGPPTVGPGAAVEIAPPPAAPKTSWFDGMRARWATKPKRNRYVMPLVVLIVLMVAFVSFTKMLGGAIAKGVSSTMTDHDQTIISAVDRVANPAAQQVTVTGVLNWLPCPLTADAKGMIGYVAGGPGLDSARASGVDTQVRKWMVNYHPKELRISQPDATHLVVFVNPITEGVPLIDCTEQDLPASPTTTAALKAGS